jgi:hypothetical protein
MSVELAIRKAELKLEKQKLTRNTLRELGIGALELAKNPVIEIVAGYMLIEWAKHQKVITEYIPPEPGIQWNWTTGFLGNLFDSGHTEDHYLIGETAASIAEGGLLIAVALQQGGEDFLKTLIMAGSQAFGSGIGLATKAIPALAGIGTS